ncbi:sugar phosphate isomerase/epimerase [Lewinella marina]|uniref:Xylose isomerase n=1 Tax=Neolewinella marina TaxID=438751 RepID=A0A2G0CDC5_9BACT|nr:TIM barrel protein [Neolewinella marina]NJB86062.1 sugar phosphate isomerase/epimerase [Neolewinella marina]PHK97974.1 xylose isomerase [Neolewinella marina]
MQDKALNRRNFLRTSTALAGGLLLAGPAVQAAPAILRRYNKPDSRINGVQIGTITYSFRTMPDQSAEATLGYITDAGISAVELMGDPAETFAGAPANPVSMRKMWTLRGKQRNETLTADEEGELADLQAQLQSYRKEIADWRGKVGMEKFRQLRRMYEDAGVDIYAFKPAAFGQDNTDAEINWGMEAAKALGANHVTLEHPGDDAHTAKLGEMGRKHGVRVAYHGHTQQTPDFWDTALRQSAGNALNLDIGHYVAAGYDPREIIRSKHASIASMHTKDRTTPANGQKNLVWGEGDTPIAEVLSMMSRSRMNFPATIELEYDIPAGSNAVQEVARCLEYCRKSLA